MVSFYNLNTNYRIFNIVGNIKFLKIYILLCNLFYIYYMKLKKLNKIINISNIIKYSSTGALNKIFININNHVYIVQDLTT